MSRNTNQTNSFFGGLLRGFGIALAVIKAFFVSVTPNVLGMARATLVGGLFLGQGAIPGATTG